MTKIFITLSTWLHVLATIIMVGYFFFTGLIFLPILAKQMPLESLRGVMEQVSARLRPYFGGSLLVFLLSGTYLMLINQRYLGLGHFFANPWSSLIVIKHLVVLIFLGLAFFSERKYLHGIGTADLQALRQFRRALNINFILGAVILLLTAVAQAG